MELKPITYMRSILSLFVKENEFELKILKGTIDVILAGISDSKRYLKALSDQEESIYEN